MNCVWGCGRQYSVVLHGNNMKFCAHIVMGVDRTWFNFHVDIFRGDVVRDVFRWRNLRDDSKEQAYRSSARICGDENLQTTNYVTEKRHVRRHLLRYQCEDFTTNSQPPWQYLDKISCWSHVRRLSTDVRNLRHSSLIILHYMSWWDGAQHFCCASLRFFYRGLD